MSKIAYTKPRESKSAEREIWEHSARRAGLSEDVISATRECECCGIFFLPEKMTIMGTEEQRTFPYCQDCGKLTHYKYHVIKNLRKLTQTMEGLEVSLDIMRRTNFRGL